MTLSARNRLEGKITELQLGGVMAHVVVQVGNNFIESVITRRSAEEMNLKVGDTVAAGGANGGIGGASARDVHSDCSPTH